jgi:hypothetical protein
MESKIILAAAASASDSFNALREVQNQSVDPRAEIRDLLPTSLTSPIVLKRLTNFTVAEFEELCNEVYPVLEATARSTGENKQLSGRSSKLSYQQLLLSTLMYFEHDNTVHYDVFQWNWAKSSVSDVVLFVCSVINIVTEESWVRVGVLSEA